MNSTDSGSLLQVLWYRWALVFFLIASLLGLTMRGFHFFEIPLDYRNILHAHSHLALLGWGFMALMGGIIFSLEKPKDLVPRYGMLFIALLLAVVGMLLSFPVQGYGAVSISFSTLFILVSYGFAYQVWKLLAAAKRTPAVRMLRLALSSYILSTLGLWALGPVSANFGKTHELYQMCIQWFLHFQLNGWFVLGTLGIILNLAEAKGHAIKFSLREEYALTASVILTYALILTWAKPTAFFFGLNGLAVSLQLLIYLPLLSKVLRAILKVRVSGFPQLLIRLALASLLLKALLQAALVFPSVAVISYTIRMYVIGFLHLVLLGTASLGLVGVGLEKSLFPKDRFSTIGWSLLIFGFLLTELLLFGQGLLVWLGLGFLPGYHHLIFCASALLPIGLGLACFGQFKTHALPIHPFPSLSQSNSKTMKKVSLWSISLVMMLMASCGGSGESQNSSNPTPSATPSETPAAADPKGIGEAKNIDLGAGVDAALADKGKAIYDMKCAACHQLGDKRLVGPGFQGVTNRRAPEWIVNMITNVEVMLDKDPTAQALLEECLTRMPNQNLSVDEARTVLEFMRKNDEEKTGQRDAGKL